MSVEVDGKIYPFPIERIWTPNELADDERRKCEVCRKVCYEIFLRVFRLSNVKNYCTKKCYEDS